MKFGPVPVSEAAGAVLAHSQVAGKRIAKGTVLDTSHVAALEAAGLAEVTVARLEAGDGAEDAVTA